MSDSLPQIDMNVVTAKPRKLSAKWTIEEQHDLQSSFGISFKKPEWFSAAWHEVAKRMKWGAGGGWWIRGPWIGRTVEDDLLDAVSAEITEEIDNEIIKDLKNQFKYQGS